MTKHFSIFFLLFSIVSLQLSAQENFIYSKEGKPVLNRRDIISKCIRALHRESNDMAAIRICECQADKLNRHFTNSEYKRYTDKMVINIEKMLQDDPVFSEEIDSCFINSGQITLLQAQGFQEKFVANCIKSIQKRTNKNLDSVKLENFCICQLNLVKNKKITDAEMETLDNPNSLLFYEMMYKCGNPFSTGNNKNDNWNANMANDITGPASDTINVLTLNGMTYVKIKTGSLVQFWLFDTGASDLVINTEMEEKLLKESLLAPENYLGKEQYEMANGSIDTCKKYRINNVRIGNYSINNVEVAVTQKGKKIIVGKALLNKFSNWILNNKNNTLILGK